MSLAHRVIPTLLARGDQLVKGKQFQSWRSIGHVAQAAKIYAARAADEIILLDISATPEGRGPNLALVEKVAKDFFTPLTVGGGVRSVQDVRDLFNAGADKVAIKTNMAIIPEASAKFGKQAIVAAVDHVDGYWARESALSVQALGAGEILLTSVDREGEMSGYDIEAIRAVSAAVDVPVIAHGGCSGFQDMVDAIRAGASAVAAGALFAFTDATPKEAARYLKANNIEARV